jgi:hypothetical protein
MADHCYREGERESKSESLVGSLSVDFGGFVTDRLQLGVRPTWRPQGWQNVDQPIDASGVRYLGRLEQTTTSLTARMTYALTETHAATYTGS